MVVLGLFTLSAAAIGVAAVASSQIPAGYCNELPTPASALVALGALAAAACTGFAAVAVATYGGWPLRRVLVTVGVACAIACPWVVISIVCAHRLAHECV
jgi:hypothetical protein